MTLGTMDYVVGFPLGKTGGLIEAPVAGVIVQSRVIRFRWVKPAASLKPVISGGPAAAASGFRWVKPAASLKRRDRLVPPYTSSSAHAFPLGKTGGLIEARRIVTVQPSGIAVGRFRWVKPAASLKPPAPSCRVCPAPSGWFPLGKTGGLIEAQATI